MAMSSQQTRLEANAINDHFEKFFSAQGVWDAPSVATAGQASDTITVPGVALGDIVLGVSSSISQGAATVTAWVSAANTVTVQVANVSGASIDLASATYRVVLGRMANFPANSAA